MKRETFTYTYRSVMGIDVGVTRELARGESRTKAIAKVKEDFRNSCTPLVELDGQQIDINDFLGNEIQRLEVDRDRLNNLIDRFKRENIRRHPHLVKKCFVVKTSDRNQSNDDYDGEFFCWHKNPYGKGPYCTGCGGLIKKTQIPT